MLDKITTSTRSGNEVFGDGTPNNKPVTVFWSRSAFETGVGSLIKSANESGRGCVILYVTAEGWNAINELCGADAGRKMLGAVSTVLRTRLRAGAVAHLGDAEFAVFLPDTGARDAETLARAVVHEIAGIKLPWKGDTLSVGAYVGGVAGGTGQDGKTLLDLAEAAGNVAKEKFGWKVHVAQQQEQGVLRWQDELLGVARINDAMERDRFVLYAQRLALLARGDTSEHLELLTRMVGDDGRLIPPQSFINAAERFGVIERLDMHILEKALQTLAVRDRADSGTVCINVSGITLSNEGFPDSVKSLLRRYRIAVSDLCLEITETAAIANMDNVRRFIAELHAIGAKIGLDDFGSGACSFQYLADLPLDYLKVDGSLIRSMAKSSTNSIMVGSICAMAKALGMKTVAEGVEDGAMLQKVRAAGFDYAQGLFIHKPEPWLAGSTLPDNDSSGPKAGG